MKGFVVLTRTEDEIEMRIAINIKSIIAMKEIYMPDDSFVQVWVSGNPEQRFFSVDQSIDKIIDLIENGQFTKAGS